MLARGSYDLRCTGVGPLSINIWRCARVPYPMCSPNLYPGYICSYPATCVSRVTFARIDAEATLNDLESPFFTERYGRGSEKRNDPSRIIKSSATVALRISSCIPYSVAPLILYLSIMSGDTNTQSYHRALFFTSSRTPARFCLATFFESFIPARFTAGEVNRLLSYTTRATASGPARAPRPASSIPPIKLRPLSRHCSSIEKSGRLCGEIFTALTTVIPLRYLPRLQSG